MLHELDIQSYAVIDHLRLSFHPGLNLMTGETGSGKSIVVDSLALLFGARTSATVIRQGAKRARLTGVFDWPASPAATARLEEAGVDPDDELVIERRVLASGKTRAYVNGSPAAMALLRDLAPSLGDIHGQHDQQTLTRAAAQLRMLDEFGGASDLARQVRDAYGQWRDCCEALERLAGDARDRLRRADLLQFQLGEISRAEVRSGEDTDLREERERILHAHDLREASHLAYGSLYDAPSSASAGIKTATDALSSAARKDKTLEPWVQALEEARGTVDDIAFELRSYLDRIDVDPQRQDEVETRLDLLERLKRKYGSTLDEVLAYSRNAGEELAALDRGDLKVERLKSELEELEAAYAELAGSLSRTRRAAAERLASIVAEHLHDLALTKARLEVDLQPLDGRGPGGLERASILFAANPGQPPRPLGKIASGGELSRVALAMKTALLPETPADGYRRTLVFDEIDTGVGGQAADAIGRRLHRLSRDSQLLCVTHLPQIARFADDHFRVDKHERDGQAVATVAALADGERVEELARMLSGSVVTEAAMENARAFLSPE